MYCLNVRSEKINVERETDTSVVFLLLETVVLKTKLLKKKTHQNCRQRKSTRRREEETQRKTEGTERRGGRSTIERTNRNGPIPTSEAVANTHRVAKFQTIGIRVYLFIYF